MAVRGSWFDGRRSSPLFGVLRHATNVERRTHANERRRTIDEPRTNNEPAWR
jgi:hypothetical protein